MSVKNGRVGSRIEGDTMFNITGVCPKCGKEIGRLKAVSTWVGTKGYPPKDPILYHVSPWFINARIYCEPH